MNWPTLHSQSETYASRAEAARRKGEIEEAERLYARAAEAESDALQYLDSSKERTLGVSAVSAVALWYKARLFDRAQSTAYRWLATGQLPLFATDQLKELLQAIWNSETLKREGKPVQEMAEPEEAVLRGVLRAVHLDKDWLEISADEGHVRINDVSEAVDDLIGPMVNRPVIVHTTKDAQGRHRFRDIESAE